MERNISNVTTTEMSSEVPDYSVSHKTIDENSGEREFYWYNSDWHKRLGYYKQIPEFKEAVKALARWAVGRGYTEEELTPEINLDNFIGWGEDSFQAIMTNHIIVKKVNGDAYAEIIRSEAGLPINLKPINPANIRHVITPKGTLKRYDIWNSKEWVAMKTEDIFHSSNDRIASEGHGLSALEACQWVIDARNEAMSDWRKILHRSSLRVIYVDMDNTTKLATLRSQWDTAIKNGEVLILPGQKGKDIEIVDYTSPPLQPFLEWIRYLEGFFYQALGVPKAIANTADFTEAASKVGYMTFEPVYTEEQTLLEQDLFSQLAIKIKFNRPPSLTGAMKESEEANTGQLGIQPNETQLTPGRNE